MPEAKVLIVGESNPYGGDDEHALYPAPDGCSGHRLCCKILGMRRAAYLDSFLRTNLVEGAWDADRAESRAMAIMRESARGSRVIVLGTKVARAFKIIGGTKFFEVYHAYAGGQPRGQYLYLPHPSGLCRVWNEPGAVAKARAAVVKFAPELAELVGQAEGDHAE